MQEKKSKRTPAKKKADDKYNRTHKEQIKEKFANVACTMARAEAEEIKAIYTAHGLKVCDVVRHAAHYLRNGGTIQAGQEPITPTQDTTTESEKE